MLSLKPIFFSKLNNFVYNLSKPAGDFQVMGHKPKFKPAPPPHLGRSVEGMFHVNPTLGARRVKIASRAGAVYSHMNTFSINSRLDNRRKHLAIFVHGGERQK